MYSKFVCETNIRFVQLCAVIVQVSRRIWFWWKPSNVLIHKCHGRMKPIAEGHETQYELGEFLKSSELHVPSNNRIIRIFLHIIVRQLLEKYYCLDIISHLPNCALSNLIQSVPISDMIRIVHGPQELSISFISAGSYSVAQSVEHNY